VTVVGCDESAVPDLRGFAAAKGLAGKRDDEVRAEMGDKFPKLIYHSIVCIGALVAQSAGRTLGSLGGRRSQCRGTLREENYIRVRQSDRRPDSAFGHLQRGLF